MGNYRDYLKKINGDLLIIAVRPPYVPLKGICSIIDWRLNGFISSLILNRKIDDVSDHPTLIPSGQKLPVQRTVLTHYNENLAQRSFDISKGIRSKNLSIVLPTGKEDENAYRKFIDELKGKGMKWAAMRSFLMNNEMLITFNEVTQENV